jgi:hypothetical protein
LLTELELAVSNSSQATPPLTERIS